jgi:hypothetical protein
MSRSGRAETTGHQSLQPEASIDRNVGQLHNAARQFPA